MIRVRDITLRLPFFEFGPQPLDRLPPPPPSRTPSQNPLIRFEHYLLTPIPPFQHDNSPSGTTLPLPFPPPRAPCATGPIQPPRPSPPAPAREVQPLVGTANSAPRAPIRPGPAVPRLSPRTAHLCYAPRTLQPRHGHGRGGTRASDCAEGRNGFACRVRWQWGVGR